MHGKITKFLKENPKSYSHVKKTLRAAKGSTVLGRTLANTDMKKGGGGGEASKCSFRVQPERAPSRLDVQIQKQLYFGELPTANTFVVR